MADTEAEKMSLRGGGRRSENDRAHHNHRRGGLGRRPNNRRSNRDQQEEEQRKIRKWGPRGVMRRIRGKGIPGEKPEGESLLTEGSGGFQDNDPYGDVGDYDQEESRPITDLGSDDGDDDDDGDFMDPQREIDYSNTQNGHGGENDHEDYDDDEEEGTSSGEEYEDNDGEEDDEDEDGDEEGYEQAPSEYGENEEDGQPGQYDDEYGAGKSNTSYHDDKGGGYRDGGDSYRNGRGRGGYRDGEDRQDHGSRRNSTGTRRRNPLLRQLSKIRRPRRRSQRSVSNLDHTNLVGGRSSSGDPYWNNNSSVKGRIEGFGSTKPDFTNPRTLREKLKTFRENRIAAGKGNDGMKKMSVGGDPTKKKSWIERVDNVIDAMVDAALPQPELEGYMTSSSRTVTRTTTSTSTGTSSTTQKNDSKMSYLRKQFGDDNAYIIYLEGEKVASELEVLAYKNRIKELETLIRNLKGFEDHDAGDSSCSDSSGDLLNARDTSTESEIEWATGVPEEGILIDLEKTTATDEQIGTPVANIALTQNTPVKPQAITSALAGGGSMLLLASAARDKQIIEDQAPEGYGAVSAVSPEKTPQSSPEKIPQWSPGENPQRAPTLIQDTNLSPEKTPRGEPFQETSSSSTESAQVINTSEQTGGEVPVDLSVRDEAKDIVNGILADLQQERTVSSLLNEGQIGEDSLLTLALKGPPNEPPCEPPVEPPSESPSEPPNEPPSEPPGEPPNESPSEPPNEPPNEPTNEPTNEPPSEPPSELSASPTQAAISNAVEPSIAKENS